MRETQVVGLDSRGEPDSTYTNVAESSILPSHECSCHRQTSHSSPKVSQSSVRCNHDGGVPEEHDVVGDEPDKHFECAVGPTLQDEDDTALGDAHKRPDLIVSKAIQIFRYVPDCSAVRFLLDFHYHCLVEGRFEAVETRWTWRKIIYRQFLMPNANSTLARATGSSLKIVERTWIATII